MKEYRATVNHAFWYDEFRQYIQLLNSGMTAAQIRTLAIEQNIFLASTPQRGKQMIGVLERRAKQLNREILAMFTELDIPNQKIVTMIAIMKMNKLIAEFMFEAYRNELIIGDNILEEHEYTAFFNKKQSESLEVAEWTNATVRRMRGVIKTFLRDSGLVVERDTKDYLNPIPLNQRLRQALYNDGQQVIIDSLTGEH